MKVLKQVCWDKLRKSYKKEFPTMNWFLLKGKAIKMNLNLFLLYFMLFKEKRCL